MAYESGLFDLRHSCLAAADEETELLDRCDADDAPPPPPPVEAVLLVLRLARPPSWPGNWLRGIYAGCVGSALFSLFSTTVLVPMLVPLSDGASFVGWRWRGRAFNGRLRDLPSRRS